MEPADFKKLESDLRRGEVPASWLGVEGGDPSTALIMMWAGRFARRVDAFYQELLREHGLQYSDYSVLAILRSSGPIAPKQLNTYLAITSGGLTKTIQRMEREGLVQRAPDPDDGRGTLVSLTEKGERTIAPILSKTVAAHEILFQDLSKDDRGRIATALRDLLDVFEAGDGRKDTREIP
jgi:DNA-binding MarR family transcriptional regulator